MKRLTYPLRRDGASLPVSAPAAGLAIFASPVSECGAALLAKELCWSLARSGIPYVLSETAGRGRVPKRLCLALPGKIRVAVCGRDADAKLLREADVLIVCAAAPMLLPCPVDEYMAPAAELLGLMKLVSPGAARIIVQTGKALTASCRAVETWLENACPDALRLSVSENTVFSGANGRMSLVGEDPDRFIARQILQVVNAVRTALGLEKERAPAAEKAM